MLQTSLAAVGSRFDRRRIVANVGLSCALLWRQRTFQLDVSEIATNAHWGQRLGELGAQDEARDAGQRSRPARSMACPRRRRRWALAGGRGGGRRRRAAGLAFDAERFRHGPPQQRLPQVATHARSLVPAILLRTALDVPEALKFGRSYGLEGACRVCAC